MAAYATYTYYTTTYLGAAIASGDFNRLALRASAVIDQVTFDRAAAIVTAGTDAATIDLIRMATCAVAEEIQAIEADGSTGGIVSESVGSHSVTYTESSVKQQSSTKRLSNAAGLYLANTGLMYRGFASGEYGGSFDEN
jgi:hypothetical protein